MRLYRLAALTLLSISLSLTLAKTPTTSSDHGFVVRKTRSHAELASRLDFKAAEDTARDVVGDVIKAVINETVGFVATRLSLKHVPVIDKPKASDKKLIHAFRMTTPNGRTKYRVLPSGGEFRLPITIGGKSYEPLADTGKRTDGPEGDRSRRDTAHRCLLLPLRCPLALAAPPSHRLLGHSA